MAELKTCADCVHFAPPFHCELHQYSSKTYLPTLNACDRFLPNAMSLDKAVEILEAHNMWRRYDGPIDECPEMVGANALGVAIDLVVKTLKSQSI